MKKFNEYKEKIEPVEPVWKWFYLEGGKSYGPYDDKPMGKKLCERIMNNREQFDEYRKKVGEVESKAFSEWYADLRSYYPEVNERIFELCYSLASERHHSSGYDEVAANLGEVIEFAMEIIKASKI